METARFVINNNNKALKTLSLEGCSVPLYGMLEAEIKCRLVIALNENRYLSKVIQRYVCSNTFDFHKHVCWSRFQSFACSCARSTECVVLYVCSLRRNFCLQFARILCFQCANIFCLQGAGIFLGGCVDILFAVWRFILFAAWGFILFEAWGFILFEAWDCILCHESEFILFAVHFILRDEQLFVICGEY